LTKLAVTSWYKPGETFKAVFRAISGAMNECLAEAISLFLVATGQVGEVLCKPELASTHCMTRQAPTPVSELLLIYLLAVYQLFLKILALEVRALSTFDVGQQVSRDEGSAQVVLSTGLTPEVEMGAVPRSGMWSWRQAGFLAFRLTLVRPALPS